MHLIQQLALLWVFAKRSIVCGLWVLPTQQECLARRLGKTVQLHRVCLVTRLYVSLFKVILQAAYCMYQSNIMLMRAVGHGGGRFQCKRSLMYITLWYDNVV